MTPLKEWSCWEIINCDRSPDCPASRSGDGPCWEMAKELDDYRSVLNVCKDCIVYVSRQRDSVLSEEDILKIMASKTDCVLKNRCAKVVSGS